MMEKCDSSGTIDRQEFVNRLQSIEKKYPVEKWLSDDIPLWPILRMKLFFEWFSANKPKETSEHKNATSQKSRQSNKVFAIVRGMVSYITQKTKPATESDYLFTGAAMHRGDFNNLFYNKFFDPINEELKSNGITNAIYVEYDEPAHHKNYPNKKAIFFLAPLYSFLKAYALFKRKRYVPVQEKQFDDFIGDAQTLLGSHYTKEKLTKELQADILSVEAYALFFDMLFKKYRTKYAMGLCYYNKPVLGMNLAAARNKVASIDIQHGSQGELHVGYANFNKTGKGFSILPDIFWCWDNASANVIREWSRHAPGHKVIVGTNPWLEFIKKNIQHKEPNAQPVILYTLQYSHVEPFILDAIVKTNSTYKWVLRMHPREVHKKNSIYDTLEEKGIRNKINLEWAIEQPLPLLLPNADVHISRFSGSIIEAAMMGVPNIILDQTGVNIYKELIDQQKAIVSLEENTDLLLTKIEEALSSKNLFEQEEKACNTFRSAVNALITGDFKSIEHD